MKQKQATPLLPNQVTPLLSTCIAIISVSVFILTFSLCFFSSWSAWANVRVPLKEFQNVEITTFMIGRLAFDVILTILHIVFYQLAIRKGIKNITNARFVAMLGTGICVFLLVCLPMCTALDGISNRGYDFSEMSAASQIVAMELLLIFISYIAGIIYAMRHYPKVKKEKAKTE